MRTSCLSVSAVLLAAIATPALGAEIPGCANVATRPMALTSHVLTNEDYPPLSLATNETGDTTLKYVVKPDGSTTSIKVTGSSGSLRLDDAAVTFVGKFKFKPAVTDGKPVACTNEIMLRWMLNPVDKPAGNPALLASAIYPEKEDFPSGAFDRKEEGLVIATIYTPVSGASTYYIRTGTAFEDLNKATLDLLKKQTLVRPTINGKAVSAMILVPVMWSLSGKPPVRVEAPPRQSSDGDVSQTSGQ
jgi:TonB family protein